MNWPLFIGGVFVGINIVFALAILVAPMLNKNRDNYEDEN